MTQITLKKDKFGLWNLPGLVTLDPTSGTLVLDRTALQEASECIVFGRRSAAEHLSNAISRLSSSILAVVGASSSKSQGIQDLLETIRETSSDIHIYKVHGCADHRAIKDGIEAVHKIAANHVLVIGGGTTLDVGKAIAGLAHQEGRQDIAAFQRGKRAVDPAKALPWIAVPTTSGTGSESTNNAVIELGDEKKSIRNIPPPAMIIADPALTDSLPLSHTIVSLVDAMSQVLEVITHEKASPKIQALGIAGFLNLAEGTEALIGATETEITEHTRDVLSWGSLLMGIAFAHAGLGLAHGLVHLCIKCGLSHGHMVGILLAPGLWVQARQNPETDLRLARVQQALTESKHKDAFDISFFEESADPQEAQYNELLTWVEDSVGRLFKRVGLYSSLREAGLSLTDLEWIASQEHALGASFGIPRRRATTDELLDVLTRAFSDR
ncbi:MAG: iron-containing alcohol dehydrogenase [Bacillota bacterium]